MPQALPILYGSPISPFVRKVVIALEEKNLPYEWKMLPPHDRDPEFRAISPMGKIPAYKDERIAVSDSSVICQYLERSHPQTPLFPSDTVEYTQALWWEEYFDDHLILAPRTYVFNAWLNPIIGRPADSAAAEDAKAKFPALWAYLETKVPADGWMVANRFSIADISLAVVFVNLGWTGYVLDASTYPRLDAYIKRVLARPSFKKCAEAEATFIHNLKEKFKK